MTSIRVLLLPSGSVSAAQGCASDNCMAIKKEVIGSRVTKCKQPRDYTPSLQACNR